MIKLAKIGCLGIVSIVILGVVIAVISGGGSRNPRSEGEARQAVADSGGGSDRNTQPPPTPRPGDRVVLGDYAYTVHGHKTVRNIGDPDLYGVAASDGAIFVIVEYTIENLTNESQTVMADDFNLLDSQGRKFNSSSEATTALLSESGQDFILSELQPGLPKKTKTAFLVPAVATEGSLRIRIPEKGIFSSGEAIVQLRSQ